MKSGDSEPTKGWVPIPSPSFEVLKEFLKNMHTSFWKAKGRGNNQAILMVLSWVLSSPSPFSVSGIAKGHLVPASTCRGKNCICQPCKSIEAKRLNGWSAVQTPRREFFSSFLQGTYIKASKHKAKDKRRYTSWSEVGRANGSNRAIQSVSSLSCIQAAASVNLSCGYLGYCSIVPHGSNPFGSFLFLIIIMMCITIELRLCCPNLTGILNPEFWQMQNILSRV